LLLLCAVLLVMAIPAELTEAGVADGGGHSTASSRWNKARWESRYVVRFTHSRAGVWISTLFITSMPRTMDGR